MSLDNIQLPPALVRDLYKKSLVDLETAQVKTDSAPAAAWAVLGRNERKVLILVDEQNTAFLPDEEMNFLLGILNACKLSMADVALLNYFKTRDMDYDSLMTKFAPVNVLFFGIEPDTLGFPLQFPNYQLQKYNGQTYLSAPSLGTIAADKAEKTKLWMALKTLFSI
ncbi:MAG: hypothetical protein JWQ27_853 [Ferruginibacter sp.]|nr:hypothetical protein [Ferruginibacter sp.]